jgi:CRP-like cAMP-binding protein
MATQPDLVEMLLRSSLLAEMEPDHRDALALRFEARPFTAGQVLIGAGSTGGELLEILAGTAEVFARDGEQRYRVAELVPGSLAGELSFFDPHTPRSADVVGSSEGIVAALPRNAYLSLVAEGHTAAAALERAVMRQAGARLQMTNARLSRLLDAHRSGGLIGALGRLFGKPTRTPGVGDG